MFTVSLSDSGFPGNTAYLMLPEMRSQSPCLAGPCLHDPAWASNPYLTIHFKILKKNSGLSPPERGDTLLQTSFDSGPYSYFIAFQTGFEPVTLGPRRPMLYHLSYKKVFLKIHKAFTTVSYGIFPF